MSLKNNIYYDDNYIKEILFTTKSIAVVGLSDKENRPSNFAAKYLKNRGYKIIPINPVTSKKNILGEKVYKTISELEFIPDMVDCGRSHPFGIDGLLERDRSHTPT